MLTRVWSAVMNTVTRGKVTGTQEGSLRPFLNMDSREGETFQRVALQMPFGMSANPTAGSDVIVLTVGGMRDHKVGLFADNTANRIHGLKPGEFGLSDAAGNRVVFREDKIEITGKTKDLIVKVLDGKKIHLEAAHVELQADGETLRRLVTEQFKALFNEHKHSGGAVPDVLMTDAHLTGATKAGSA